MRSGLTPLLFARSASAKPADSVPQSGASSSAATHRGWTLIGEVRTWAEAPFEGPIKCTLTGRSSKGRKSVSDLAFHDASGALLAEFIGVETHLLPEPVKA